MTWDQLWPSIVIALIGLTGVVYTARTGKRSTDQGSQVELIGTLMERIKTLEAGQQELWRLREEDAKTKRAQGDHIDTLEHHIWQQKPPPPPPRPPGV
ncbi:MAG: hypothetical protein QM628_00225 [Propionicimonas sp.]